MDEERVFEKALGLKIQFESLERCNAEIVRLRAEQSRYYSLCSGLYEDLKEKIITQEEYERLYGEFKRRAAELEEAQKKQEFMIKEMVKNSVISAGRLSAMRECCELKEVDRRTLCSMVREISVFENRRIEIEFYYTDKYRVLTEENKNIGDRKAKQSRAERSA